MGVQQHPNRRLEAKIPGGLPRRVRRALRMMLGGAGGTVSVLLRTGCGVGCEGPG